MQAHECAIGKAMGVRTVEIDEYQALSVEELCGRLAESLNWPTCEISHDEECPWDVHFANSSGEYWMLLNGLVFPTAECVREPAAA